MEENQIKICPSPHCKMPILKIDGCNNVYCTYCRKTMDYGTVELAHNYFNKLIESLSK